MLKAVLFDLDGTLLPIDTGAFMEEYLKEIAAAVAPVTEPNRFLEGLLSSTRAMLVDRNPELTNEQVFWAHFRPLFKDCMEELEPVIEDFYATKFSRLKRAVSTSPHARRAVQAAVDRDMRIVLATNPVFPEIAIRERMDWAGVGDLPWELVTSYEEMHFCKPHPEYYREIAERLQLQPRECLVVGNDATEDLAAAVTGMYTCLATDCLIEPENKGYRADWTGTLAELASQLERWEG